MVTRSCYLGGFIGDPAAEKYCIYDKVKGWNESVEVMDGVLRQHLQTAYYGMKKSPQQEWDLFQRSKPGIREFFCKVEEALQHLFLPDLFCRYTAKVLDWGVNHLPVNQAGLALTNPNLSNSENWIVSNVAIGPLIAYLQLITEFKTIYHYLLLLEGRGDT